MDSRQRRRSRSYLKRRRERRRHVILFFVVLLCVVTGILMIKNVVSSRKEEKAVENKQISFVGAPPLEVNLLTINSYSRPGIALGKVKGIVVHYTGNPGTTAINNRNYFEGLKDNHEAKVSSHFVIGLDGEIVQCIPSSEISYASNQRNKDTLSIECCHPDESGKFNDTTYQSLVKLTAWLCVRFDLNEKDVIRHFDVTGKECPKYFVENETDWEQFRNDVKAQIEVVKTERENLEKKEQQE